LLAGQSVAYSYAETHGDFTRRMPHVRAQETKIRGFIRQSPCRCQSEVANRLVPMCQLLGTDRSLRQSRLTVYRQANRVMAAHELPGAAMLSKNVHLK